MSQKGIFRPFRPIWHMVNQSLIDVTNMAVFKENIEKLLFMYKVELI